MRCRRSRDPNVAASLSKLMMATLCHQGPTLILPSHMIRLTAASTGMLSASPSIPDQRAPAYLTWSSPYSPTNAKDKEDAEEQLVDIQLRQGRTRPFPALELPHVRHRRLSSYKRTRVSTSELLYLRVQYKKEALWSSFVASYFA